jgi:hypothetical protein
VDKLSVVLVAVLGVILLGENSTCANGAASADHGRRGDAGAS